MAEGRAVFQELSATRRVTLAADGLPTNGACTAAEDVVHDHSGVHEFFGWLESCGSAFPAGSEQLA